MLVITLILTCVSFRAESEQSNNQSAVASSDEGHHFYRNPEERREAGLGTAITDWLKISGLVELEREQARTHFIDGISSTEKGNLVKTLQLGFDFRFAEHVEAELVVEAEDDDKSRLIIDEVSISWEWDEIGLTVGRYSPNFGEYYSHLITGPILEFGETRANTVSIDYSFNEQLQIELFFLESEVDSSTKSNEFDWGMLLEWESEDESFRLGASYLSDIGESDEGFFYDFNSTYQDRIAALSAYALWGFDNVEITAEMVKTLTPIKEFDDKFNQPQAFNFELAFYPTADSQLALRYETSDQLEDSPEKRYGFGVRWQVFKNINVAAEYLVAKYPIEAMREGDESDESDENSIDDEYQLALQVSIEF
jgi:hypothetical protein